MIILVKGQSKLLFFNSTKYYDTDQFKFIITSTSTLETKVINLTKQDSTLRYDSFPIDDTVLDISIGNYDFVLVEDTFAGSYDTVMDILLNYHSAVVQTGKFRVRSNDETEIVEYITEKIDITDYEPDNI